MGTFGKETPSPYPLPLPPSHPPPPSLITINVGRAGFCESVPHLLPLFDALPAAVLIQETHLEPSALAGARALVHRLLPMYCMFFSGANRLARRGTRPQVVSLIHVQLAARASLLDVSNADPAVAAPDILCHAQFIRVTHPRPR